MWGAGRSRKGWRPPALVGQGGLLQRASAVNVSPVQLRQKNFVDMVRDAIEASASGAHGLDLEITESSSWRTSRQYREAARRQGPRGGHLHRRLRHWIFIARLSEQTAGHGIEDRPLISSPP